MTRRRKLSTFLGRTPQGVMVSAVCGALIVLLAACGGGSPTGGTTGGTTGGGGGLSGGTDISGRSILFEISEYSQRQLLCAGRQRSEGCSRYRWPQVAGPVFQRR